MTPHKFETKLMNVYIKVVKIDNQRSVAAFIDKDGNILFPASWKAPTKSSPIRGNINDLDNRMNSVGVYGVNYKKWGNKWLH